LFSTATAGPLVVVLYLWRLFLVVETSKRASSYWRGAIRSLLATDSYLFQCSCGRGWRK